MHGDVIDATRVKTDLKPEAADVRAQEPRDSETAAHDTHPIPMVKREGFDVCVREGRNTKTHKLLSRTG